MVGRKAAKVLGFILLWLFVILAAAILLIRLPMVQNKIVDRLQTYLQKTLQTKVTIGGAYIGFPKSIELEGLYLPDSSIHMMFMRFPIDALFMADPGVDGGRRVVGMREHLPPWRGLVMPVRGAQGVVELPAGTLSRYQVSIGDTFVIENADEVKTVVSAT